MICPHCHCIVPARQTCDCRPARQHPSRATRLEREPHRSEYDTQAYRRARQVVLERQRGLCAGCGTEIAVKKNGKWKTKPGGGTNHVEKLRDEGTSDPGNMTALCRRCHVKADRED
jgi:5-methylcytosine-specific restriction endonuclease McrA